jgi:GNAT superfamily N-acetyltransferase
MIQGRRVGKDTYEGGFNCGNKQVKIRTNMNESITVRKAEEKDAAPIHELHLRSVRQLCSAVYSPEIIEGWLMNRTPQGYLPGINRGEMYVAEINGRIVGFGHAVPGEIEATYVDPAYVRRGIGSLLVKHGIDLASAGEVRTIRIVSTLNARSLYEKCGFKATREITVRRNFVEISAIELHRKLP